MDGLKRNSCQGPVRAYSYVSAEHTVVKGLLMRDNPVSMRSEMLKKIHERHQGITKYPLVRLVVMIVKTNRRASAAVPNML